MQGPSIQETVPYGPGRRVSNYEIVAEIGRGGMGIVYRAHDLRLGRDVALKRPWPELASEPEYQRRFLQEARAASQLAHPNIVPVYEVLEEQGTPWIVLQFIEGDSLKAALEQRGAFRPEDAMRYGEELCSALQAAHARRILHRDIKPTNVLLTSDNRPMLSDFGLARILGDTATSNAITASATMTGEGRILGTPGYMSPEQALGHPLDARSDIFSLGAVLYEMCTGQAAFKRANTGETFDAVLNREPVSMVRLAREVPEELERIVRKAVSKRPEERYQSALEMAVDLRTLRRRLDSASTATATQNPAARRRRALLIGALATTTGLAGGAILVRRAVQPSELPVAVPRQLTSRLGWENEPAISPDGGMVAFVSAESGNPDIWLIDVRGGVPLRLTDHPAPDRSPAWFPDSSALALVSERAGRNSIYRVNRLGGPLTLLIENADAPAISPDGAQIAFLRAGPSGEQQAMLAPIDHPEDARLLASGDQALWGHASPTFSPDGRSLCLADFRHLWLVPLSGGRALKLTHDDSANADPTFSADGRSLYFTSSREGTQALWRIGTDGGDPERITMGTGPESEPSLSRDGRRMSYSTYFLNTDLVFHGLDSGSETRIAGLREESQPRIRPDGGAVVFVSDRERGKHDLWLIEVRSGRPEGQPRRLSNRPGKAAAPSWSPDGRHIAFYTVLNQQRDIYVMSAEGGEARPCAAHEASDIHPVFSPDGRQLAFISSRGGSSRVWLTDFEDGACRGVPRPLTAGSETEMFPVFAPDGEELAVQRAGSGIMRIPLRAPGPARPASADAGLVRADYEPQGRSLLVSGIVQGRMTLRRLELESGTMSDPLPGVEFGEAATLGDFDLSPDGRLLVYTQEELRGDIWVLEASRGVF